MKIAITFRRFGPYHLARLQGAITACGQDQVIGLELAKQDSVYPWDEAKSDLPIITAFPKWDVTACPAQMIRDRLLQLYREHGIECAFVQGWTKWGLAGLHAATQLHIPAVVMSESSEHDVPRRGMAELFKRIVMRLYSAGLVGGETHFQYLAKLGLPENRICKGYDIVDNNAFIEGSDAARKDLAATKRALKLPRPYFLASNRFVEKKNLLRLLEAYANYRNTSEQLPWDLVILGDGPERGRMTRRADELGLNLGGGTNGGVVHLPGFRQYADLPNYYGAASAFVHASTTEQWGLVVNEAMASSLPVIVSNRCGCATELVEEGQNGYLFDPLDVDRLAFLMKRMHTAADSERREMGRKSRDRIAAWGPERFGQAVAQSTRMAMADRDRRPTWGGRLLAAYLRAT